MMWQLAGKIQKWIKIIYLLRWWTSRHLHDNVSKFCEHRKLCYFCDSRKKMNKDEIFENNEIITIYTDVNVILRRPVCTCSVLKLSNVHWIYVRLFAYITTYFSTLVHNMVPNTVEFCTTMNISNSTKVTYKWIHISRKYTVGLPSCILQYINYKYNDTYVCVN